MLHGKKITGWRTLCEADDPRLARHPHHFSQRTIRCRGGFLGTDLGMPILIIRRLRRVVGITSNKCSPSSMGAQETFGTQFGIGVNHANAADVELLRQITAGWKTCASRQYAAFNL